jgi:hypothetical protein
MKRREYDIDIAVNGRRMRKLIIDPHYAAKHSRSVNDDLIIKLVHLLNGGVFPVQGRRGPYEYFVTDRLMLGTKAYKLVWLLEDDQIYIGVVNAYRRN